MDTDSNAIKLIYGPQLRAPDCFSVRLIYDYGLRTLEMA